MPQRWYLTPLVDVYVNVNYSPPMSALPLSDQPAAPAPGAATGLVAPDPGYQARVRDSFARQPAMGLVGATLSALAPGYCEVRLPFRQDLTQQHGFVHGGVVGMIADSACGYAGYSMMPADSSVLTVEYKINMLSPAQGEQLAARGRVLKPGKSLVITQCEVFAITGGAEKLVAVMQQTLMVMHGRSDHGTPPAAQAAQQQ